MINPHETQVFRTAECRAAKRQAFLYTSIALSRQATKIAKNVSAYIELTCETKIKKISNTKNQITSLLAACYMIVL
jgi:CRISPR/Cas system-associated protein Cas10 (large subunit of type III CRISPR-Cas system)